MSVKFIFVLLLSSQILSDKIRININLHFSNFVNCVFLVARNHMSGQADILIKKSVNHQSFQKDLHWRNVIVWLLLLDFFYINIFLVFTNIR